MYMVQQSQLDDRAKALAKDSMSKKVCSNWRCKAWTALWESPKRALSHFEDYNGAGYSWSWNPQKGVEGEAISMTLPPASVEQHGMREWISV